MLCNLTVRPTPTQCRQNFAIHLALAKRWLSDDTHSDQDHYETLGIGKTASSKEVKSRYYELSKKHHPDANPENRDHSARTFRKLTAAYEVLGSPERRKAYDASQRAKEHHGSPFAYDHSRPHRPRSPFAHDHHRHREPYEHLRRHGGMHERKSHGAQDDENWDFDDDYRAFAEFQRIRRRRSATRMSRKHAWQMPPEFYEAFGSHEKPSGSFKSSFDRGVIFEDDLKWRDQHGRMEQPRPLVDTDELRERVRRETEILREKEEIERKFNVPTFEQMRRERADARLKKDKDLFAALSVFFFVTLLFVVVASPPHR